MITKLQPQPVFLKNFGLFLIVVILFLTMALPCNALVREFPAYRSYEQTTVVDDPTLQQYFYGELTDFPHNYEFTLLEETEIFIEVLVPDTAAAENNRNAIIVKKNVRAPVDEIARLHATEADWETFYEPWAGDSYRRGSRLQTVLQPGEYLLEVNTIENDGKYVLAIGTKSRPLLSNLWSDAKAVYAVKQFFGKSPLAVLQSPYYLVPAIIVLLILGFYYFRRQNNPQT